VYESAAAEKLTRAYTKACIQEHMQEEQMSPGEDEDHHEQFFDRLQKESMRYIE
jgi:hypothetical protein